MSEVEGKYLNVKRPVPQRAIDDVLVRITPTRGERTGTVMYMSHGRAAMALARYSRARLATHPNQRFIVERLEPKREES
jgi:hypothetical protein